jgi:hypothetical protein
MLLYHVAVDEDAAHRDVLAWIEPLEELGGFLRFE